METKHESNINVESGDRKPRSSNINARYIITIALFLIPLIIIGVISVFDTDATMSVRENRMLKKIPTFSFEELLFGDYIKEFEEYYVDTFPYRDDIMGANTELNRLYYITLPSSKEDVTLLIPQDNDIALGGESALPDPDDSDVSPDPDAADNITDPEDMPDSENGASDVDSNCEDSNFPSSPSPSDDPENSETGSDPAEVEDQEPVPELETPDKADLRSGSIIIVGDRAMEITNAIPAVMAQYADTLNLYQEKMPDLRVICLITPNGGEFYSPEEFHTGIHSQKNMIEETYSQMDDSIIKVDAYSELRKHTDEYIFFRTDHHWTQLGAYFAYVAFCNSLELEPYTLDQFETGTIEGFVGSMYTYTAKYPQSSVLKDNPDTVHYYRPIRDFKSRIYTDSRMDESTAYNGYVISSKVKNKNKYLAFISGDTPLMRIKTDVGNGKKIIVIKESYGNAFVPFLVNHYEEIYVVDPRKYSGKDTPDFDLPSFVDEHAIDDVLVIDYPLVVSSERYVNILRNIIK
jgi:hypothetical protein